MRLSPRRLWLLAFAGFFLMAGAWAVAAPYDGSPDEVQHIFRAVGVVSGEVGQASDGWLAGDGGVGPVVVVVVEPCWQGGAAAVSEG